MAGLGAPDQRWVLVLLTLLVLLVLLPTVPHYLGKVTSSCAPAVP